jgi:hypothetical protein
MNVFDPNENQFSANWKIIPQMRPTGENRFLQTIELLIVNKKFILAQEWTNRYKLIKLI